MRVHILRFAILHALAFGAMAQEATRDLAGQLQQEAITYAETHTAGALGNLTFRVVRPPNLPRFQPGTVSFEPTHLSKQECSGPFFVAFRVLIDGRPAGTTRVDLEGRWVGRLLKAKAALPRAAVPTDDQVEESSFEGVPPTGALTELPKGSRLRVPVQAGHVLTRADFQPIPLVNPGDQIRLEMVCGPLIVASDVVARSGGALGDKIRLELPTNRKSVQAVITGPGEARMDWAKPR